MTIENINQIQTEGSEEKRFKKIEETANRLREVMMLTGLKTLKKNVQIRDIDRSMKLAQEYYESHFGGEEFNLVPLIADSDYPITKDSMAKYPDYYSTGNKTYIHEHFMVKYPDCRTKGKTYITEHVRKINACRLSLTPHGLEEVALSIDGSPDGGRSPDYYKLKPIIRGIIFDADEMIVIHTPRCKSQ